MHVVNGISFYFGLEIVCLHSPSAALEPSPSGNVNLDSAGALSVLADGLDLAAKAFSGCL